MKQFRPLAWQIFLPPDLNCDHQCRYLCRELSDKPLHPIW